MASHLGKLDMCNKTIFSNNIFQNCHFQRWVFIDCSSLACALFVVESSPLFVIWLNHKGQTKLCSSFYFPVNVKINWGKKPTLN
jgi:hypothetical protein